MLISIFLQALSQIIAMIYDMMSLKIHVFWKVRSCRPAKCYQRFGGE